MAFLKSIIVAFSMFSAIPVPRVEWNKKNMRYMMAAFPLVGVAISVLCALWFVFCVRILETGARSISIHFFALGFTLIPVLVTGGIHVDGFMDTSDALGSHASREKKLAILKDSHAGAFAVLGCVLYFLSFYVLSYELFDSLLGIASRRRFVNFFAQFMQFLPVLSIFVISRLLSAFAVATFPIAKNSGLVHTFASESDTFFTALWCEIWLFVISLALIFLHGKSGAIPVFVSLAVFFYYFVMTKRNFGGITGDTAGWFVQMSEILALAGFVILR